MNNQSPAVSSSFSAAASNFMASFNTSGGGGLAGLFDKLLATAQTLSVAQKFAANTSSNGSGLSSIHTASDPSQTGSVHQISDVIAGLRDFVSKWSRHAQSNANQQQNSNGASSQSATSSQTSNTTTSSATTTANTTAGSSSSASTQACTSASNASANDPSTSDASAPPSFADLVAQLQSILQMLQKQLQTAQSGAGIDTANATTSDGSTTSLQDMLAAGSALADLLALGQKLEKKLGLNATNDAASATPASDPNLAALDAQLKNNLKNLLDSLQKAAAGNDTNAVADTTTTTVTTLASTLTDSIANITKPSTPDDIIKGALDTADDFMKQLNSLYGTASNAAAPIPFLSSDALAASTSKDGASFTADQDGDANTATNLSDTTQTAGTNATPENQKAANPYSFASQLSAARAQNGGTIGLPTAVEQVLLLLNRNAKSGNDQMSIQLHPADLGTINIKLDMASNGTVSGTVTANNADTLSMLQKDSRSLERALEEAGLRADPGSLQFSLSQQQNSNNFGQAASNSSSGGTPADTLASGLAALTSDSSAETNDSWVITPGRINIRV